MRALFLLLSGVLTFVLGVLANLDELLPESLARAADAPLPFELEVVEVEPFAADWAFQRPLRVRVRAVNRTDVSRTFPFGALVVTDGQAETLAPRFDGIGDGLPLAPGHAIELVREFDVPLEFRRARLELEAAAFSEPELGLVHARRVLLDDLANAPR